jgi:hypothetical protein
MKFIDKYEKFALTDKEILFESKLNVIRQDIPYETFEKNPKTGEFNKEKRISGKSKIIDYNDRKIVLFDVNGVNIPFYLSSGHANKRDVQSGKWYPFFGIGSDGWFNKLSGKEINNYYGIDILRKIAEELDKKIGDIRSDKSVPKVTLSGPHIKAINRGLTPTENGMSTSVINFYKNFNNFKKSLENAIMNQK